MLHEGWNIFLNRVDPTYFHTPSLLLEIPQIQNWRDEKHRFSNNILSCLWKVSIKQGDSFIEMHLKTDKEYKVQ